MIIFLCFVKIFSKFSKPWGCCCWVFIYFSMFVIFFFCFLLSESVVYYTREFSCTCLVRFHCTCNY